MCTVECEWVTVDVCRCVRKLKISSCTRIKHTMLVFVVAVYLISIFGVVVAAVDVIVSPPVFFCLCAFSFEFFFLYSSFIFQRTIRRRVQIQFIYWTAYVVITCVVKLIQLAPKNFHFAHLIRWFGSFNDIIVSSSKRSFQMVRFAWRFDLIGRCCTSYLYLSVVILLPFRALFFCKHYHCNR